MRATFLVGLLAWVSLATVTRADEPQTPEHELHRPSVPGTFLLQARSRVQADEEARDIRPQVAALEWNAAETAIIVIDMWDGHYVQQAAHRVSVMAPKVDAVLSAARDRGVLIIHAPSGVVNQYADLPFRRRIQGVPAIEPPCPIIGCWEIDPDREPPLPVDVEQPSDDPRPRPAVQMFSAQHPDIHMLGYDVVSDSGNEIYSYCQMLGIKNIAVLGVHTNMCILGRPFGIRSLVKLGFNVVLVRDLTDAMYDPRSAPFVSHSRGTELVIEHIEQYWCPSILSDDLTRVIPGSDGPVTEAAIGRE